jgi:hypothetical protein
MCIRKSGPQTLAVLVMLAVAAVLAASALAGKPSGPKGAKYTGTLIATPNTLQAGDYFDVSGCDYDPSLGYVIVSFTGASFATPLDADGCFTVTHIPALSGDTLAPGTYEVRALQYVHNKWTETGETTVTVVP